MRGCISALIAQIELAWWHENVTTLSFIGAASLADTLGFAMMGQHKLSKFMSSQAKKIYGLPNLKVLPSFL